MKSESNELALRSPASQLGNLLFNPSAFFREVLPSLKVRTVSVVYIEIGVIVSVFAVYQQTLLGHMHDMPAEQVIRALPYCAFYGLLMVAAPVWYLALWRAAHDLWPKGMSAIMPHEVRQALFVILCGAIPYAMGLLVQMSMMYLTSNPEWSLSIGGQLTTFGIEKSLLTWILTRIDVFLIWEIIIMAAGFRVLYDWRQPHWRHRSYVLATGITQVTPVVLLVLARYVSGGV